LGQTHLFLVVTTLWELLIEIHTQLTQMEQIGPNVLDGMKYAIKVAISGTIMNQ